MLTRKHPNIIGIELPTVRFKYRTLRNLMGLLWPKPKRRFNLDSNNRKIFKKYVFALGKISPQRSNPLIAREIYHYNKRNNLGKFTKVPLCADVLYLIAEGHFKVPEYQANIVYSKTDTIKCWSPPLCLCLTCSVRKEAENNPYIVNVMCKK